MSFVGAFGSGSRPDLRHNSCRTSDISSAATGGKSRRPAVHFFMCAISSKCEVGISLSRDILILQWIRSVVVVNTALLQLANIEKLGGT